MRDMQSTSPRPRPDAAEVSRSAPLDAAAFAIEFRNAYRVLWLIALGVLADRHLAEDAVQEAVIVGLRKIDSFEPGTNFGAWMGQIVRHTALNHRRKQHRRGSLSLDAGGGQAHAAAGGNEPPVIDQRGVLRNASQHFDDRLLAALQSIGEVARACLLLRTIEGLDYKEIARVLDIPPGTAMSHVYRTRQALRQMLSDDSSKGTGPARATS
ncbi:MAG: RNA polymerase sigma factor [Phycisphaerales bacterium]